MFAKGRLCPAKEAFTLLLKILAAVIGIRLINFVQKQFRPFQRITLHVEWQLMRSALD